MDWIGTGLLIVSLYLMAHHRHQAVVIGLISDVAWIVYAVQTGTWSLIVCQSVILVLSIRTVLAWRKEKEQR